jgi:hypothetical protein
VRTFLAAGALLLLGAGSPPAPCTTAGCFTGAAEGVRAGALNGKAVYRVTPEGDLLIVLIAPGAVPLTVLFSRDSGGAPARGGDLTVVDEVELDEGPQGSPADLTAMMSGITAGLDSLKAGGVDVSEAQRSLAPDPSRGASPAAIHAGITGGSAFDPAWLIPAGNGTLHLDAASGGVLAGRFEVSGEGRTVESDDPVTITVRGTFRAKRVP